MFIDHIDLKNLENKRDLAGAITLYLYSSPQETYQAYRMKVHSLFDELKKKLKKFENKKNKTITEDIAALEEKTIDSFAEKKGETFCIFIASDFKKIVKVPIKLKDQVLINDSFYLLPLTKAINQFNRYGILVFNRQKACFFTYFIDKLKEEKSVFHDYVLPNIKESSATDSQGSQWGSKNIANKEEETYNRHLKEIANIVFKNFKAKKFDKLILSSHEDKINSIKPYLHSYLSSNLVGEFTADIEMPENKIRKLAEQTVNSIRKKNELDKIEELLAAHAHNKAVLGVNSVLDAIREKNIKELVINDDFTQAGFACAKNHFIAFSGPEDNLCPICSQELKKVEHLESQIADKSFKQGANVYSIITDKDRFNKYNIGALLRF
ncbi:MAG: hypothetical protein K9L96_05190 [Candidatus Omnitrophica bacterium]|nr:hypothetical protein [Candidatus Omnitrophota bacterium]